MIALLQRVTEASVIVNNECVESIDEGLMVLVGVERGDTEKQASKLIGRLLSYRVFEDETGKMNRSLAAVEGGLLLVPQFTLPANTNKGTRPSFTPAASPDVGKALFEYVVRHAHSVHSGKVQTGVFGANMSVALVNNGPVTFWLQVAPD